MAFSLMSWINGSTKLNSSTMTQFQTNIKNAFDADDARISKLESGGGGDSVSVPIGGIIMWGSSTIPSNFLVCEGQDLNKTSYSKLYSVIGDTFSYNVSSTTFRLPDFRNRFPFGSLSSNIGQLGGNNSHTLTKAELPNYNLTVTDPRT